MLPHLKLRTDRGRPRRLGKALPLAVKLGFGASPTSVTYDDGVTEPSSCIRCSAAPCHEYAEDELRLSKFAGLASDMDRRVCPTDALSFAEAPDRAPRVTESACIGCGLCAARCPVGAIRLVPGGKAVVADDDRKYLPLDDESGSAASEVVAAFRTAKWTGSHAVEGDALYEALSVGIQRGLAQSPPRFAALLTRNLLLGVGWEAAMRRVGDTSLRMDVIASRLDTICVTEVEFSEAAVDAPRSVLDGYAVLASRHKVAKGNLTGLVVLASMPNRRQEYFRVVSDIQNVLGIRIRTITATTLAAAVLSRDTLTEFPMATEDEPSIRPGLAKILGRDLNVTVGAAAALESAK